MSAELQVAEEPITSEAASTPTDAHPLAASGRGPSDSRTSTRIPVFHVDLICLLCGRALGVLKTHRWPSRAPALFRPASQSRAVEIADWCCLRCPTCGGNVYPDEVSTVWVYPPVRWDDERPRRGRPPKWLLAQRQAAGVANAP